MAQKFLIDFYIVPSDLFSEVLNVRVKPRAELSNDQHLVFALYEFQNLGRTENRVGPVWLTGKNGRSFADRDVRKQFAFSMAIKFRQLLKVSEDIKME